MPQGHLLQRGQPAGVVHVAEGDPQGGQLRRAWQRDWRGRQGWPQGDDGPMR